MSATHGGRDSAGRMETVGRVLFSLVFVAAGVQHLFATDAVLERLAAARLGFLAVAVAPPRLLVVATGVVLVAAGLALLANLRARLAAMMLAGVLIPISVTALAGTPGEMGPLMKNVALLGGLLQIVARSGGEERPEGA